MVYFDETKLNATCKSDKWAWDSKTKWSAGGIEHRFVRASRRNGTKYRYWFWVTLHTYWLWNHGERATLPASLKLEGNFSGPIDERTWASAPHLKSCPVEDGVELYHLYQIHIFGHLHLAIYTFVNFIYIVFSEHSISTMWFLHNWQQALPGAMYVEISKWPWDGWHAVHKSLNIAHGIYG